MKKFLSKCICVAVNAVAIMTFVFTPVYAADTITDSVDMGFSASSDSTWGDLYRFFEPETFEELPTEVQMLYNNTLLENVNSNSKMVQDDNTLLKDMNTISKMLQTVKFDDDMTIVSTQGYLYPENGESTGVEEDSKLNTRSIIDMKGLINLTMGVSSSKNKIEYTTAMTSTKKCPKVGINMSLYDTSTEKYVALNSDYETDAFTCSMDDSFTGLISKRKYKVIATGYVVPPNGYFAPMLSQEINKSTK